MSGPRAEYRRRVAAGQLADDPAQQPVIDELERLHRDLALAAGHEASLAGRLGRLLGRRSRPVRGIYLWGGVGRGKTLLMDLFFHSLPAGGKKRQHFHRFMASVHDRLRTLRDAENPLDSVADQLAAECRVICFDEFAVNDIADAMILGNLFRALFARGVTLTATSNIAPRDLYRDGLQRSRFLPAIAAIEEHTTVLEILGERDYRLRLLEAQVVYQSPDDASAESYLAQSFRAFAPDEGSGSGTLEILGRPVDYRLVSDGVLWLDFAAACDGPRSQDDYIEIAREFQTVLISHVPRFDATLENQARRFIALVDEFYDRRVKLILSAAVPLDQLYAGSKLQMQFERTLSRLIEMQSRSYFAAAHRP